MAKLSARGAHKVGHVVATNGAGTRMLFALRSDGKVLRRIADGDISTGYSIYGTLRHPRGLDALAIHLERRGMTIIETKKERV